MHDIRVPCTPHPCRPWLCWLTQWYSGCCCISFGQSRQLPVLSLSCSSLVTTLWTFFLVKLIVRLSFCIQHLQSSDICILISFTWIQSCFEIRVFYTGSKLRQSQMMMLTISVFRGWKRSHSNLMIQIHICCRSLLSQAAYKTVWKTPGALRIILFPSYPSPGACISAENNTRNN